MVMSLTAITNFAVTVEFTGTNQLEVSTSVVGYFRLIEAAHMLTEDVNQHHRYDDSQVQSLASSRDALYGNSTHLIKKEKIKYEETSPETTARRLAPVPKTPMEAQQQHEKEQEEERLLDQAGADNKELLKVFISTWRTGGTYAVMVRDDEDEKTKKEVKKPGRGRGRR